MATASGGRFERALSIVLTGAVLVLAVEAVSRMAAARGPAPPGGGYLKGWESVLDENAVPTSADRLLVVEFADLECSACRDFHKSTLPALRGILTAEFDLAVVHFPLRGRKFSRAAAAAAECAADEGSFGPFIEAVLGNQDSIGLRPWTMFAEDVGVPNMDRFAECVASGEKLPRIDSITGMARRLGVLSTPTVLVNGWRVSPPTEGEIARVIRDLLDGREPYD